MFDFVGMDRLGFLHWGTGGAMIVIVFGKTQRMPIICLSIAGTLILVLPHFLSSSRVDGQ